MFISNAIGIPFFYGEYNLAINEELTLGADSVIPVSSTFQSVGNYITVTSKFTFIPTQVDPTIAFVALFNQDAFSDQGQAAGCANVSLVTDPTGMDGSVKISSSSSSSCILFNFITPDFDSIQVYECQTVYSYTVAPLSSLAFVTTWDTEGQGSDPGGTEITLPLSSSGTYNFAINWGDGNIDIITSWDQVETTHTYTEPGIYTTRIIGPCQGWAFRDNPGDNVKLLEISQWGNFKMGDGTLEGGYFSSCTQLKISAIDVPDLTGVFSFKDAFYNSAITNIPLLDQWIISDITSLENCFGGCVSFVGDGIEAWDVRNVETFASTFSECEVFNATVGLWVTSSAENLDSTFDGCESFNQNLGAWDVSLVSNFNRTFNNCILFTGEGLSSWITDSALGSNSTFKGCNSFNQDLSGWNFSNVSDAASMLDYTALSTANYDALLISLAAQTVQNAVPFGAINIQYSIAALSAHNTLTNSPNDWVITDAGLAGAFIANWDTEAQGELPGSTTITLPLVSTGTYNFFIDWGDGTTDTITAYDQAEVTHDYGTPGLYTTTIAGTLNGWCFRDVIDSSIKILELVKWGTLQMGNQGGSWYNTYYMTISATDIPDLTGITSFNQMFWSSWINTGIPNIDLWDVSNITDMTECFKYTGFDGTGLNSWDVSNVTTMRGMFEGSNFNTLLDSWITTACTDMSLMFLQSIFDKSVNTFDMTNVTTIAYMFASSPFNSAIDLWNLPACIDASYAFDNCWLFNQNLFSSGNWATPLVQDFSGFLLGAASFNQPMDDLDVSSCRNFTEMFRQTLFDQPLSSWNTQNAENFNAMFRLCPFSQDISMWDLSNGPDLSAMFHQASYNSSISYFDVSACSKFQLMFAESNFNGDISGFNMSNATDISYMFFGNTAFNQALPWDTSSVTSCDSCFEGCSSFNSFLSGWTITANSSQRMFYGCTALNQSFASCVFQNVSNSSYMFFGCTSLDQDFSSFNVQNLNLAFDMFSGVTLSNANYNKTLVGWNSNTPNISVTFDGGNSHYDTTSGGVNGVAAHDDLTGFYGWTITDGGTP